MSNKRFDFSVLPDGFLVQIPDEDMQGNETWEIDLMCQTVRDIDPASKFYRPLLNHWHFNDGSMVLPDGLVVQIYEEDGEGVVESNAWVTYGMKNLHDGADGICNIKEVSAFRVIGAHPDYAEHAKELGMPVVEL